MKRRWWWLAALALPLVLPACASPGGEGKVVRLQGRGLVVTLDAARGVFDMTLEDGRVVLERAHGEVELGMPGDPDNPVFRTSGRYSRSVSRKKAEDRLGPAELAELVCSGLAGAPDLKLVLAMYPDRPHLAVSLEAANPGAGRISAQGFKPTVRSIARRDLRVSLAFEEVP